MVPIIWLYITVVVVVITFSIIVLCKLISLLLVIVGIIYSRMVSRIDVVFNILFDGENISFDASLVMYINSTSIPPIMIMNRMYENQKLLCIVPLLKHTLTLCISSISPMAMGCFICVNINLVLRGTISIICMTNIL